MFYPQDLERTGLAFTWNGRVNIKNNKYQNDDTPLDKNCKNLNLNKYSKNYLNHFLIQMKF